MNQDCAEYEKRVKKIYDDSVSVLAKTIYSKILALKIKQIRDNDSPFNYYGEGIKALEEILDELNLRNKI